MAMSAPTQPPPDVPRPVMTGLTWQQFLDLPEEYKHADLVNGELFVNPPVLLHQQIVTRLLSALERWTAVAPDRGEVTFNPAVQISHDRGYMPDIAWWRQDKCAPQGQPPAFDGPPDVVVEVLSPSTRRLDTIRKRNDYPRIGVSDVWFIDPDEPSAVIVRPHSDAEQTVDITAVDELRSPLLDGFAVELGALTRR
jgi:Uma2 family endonuclease